jgi:hypothetical protein
MLKRLPKKNGMALLLIVLVIGTVSLGALSALAINSLNGFLDAKDFHTAISVRAKVMGCLDEALIHLQKDNAYAPNSVISSNATCTLAITTPNNGQRLIITSLVDQNITRSVHATVTLTPFAVTQVTEP